MTAEELTGQYINDLVHNGKIDEAFNLLHARFDKIIRRNGHHILSGGTCDDPSDHSEEMTQLAWKRIYLELVRFLNDASKPGLTNPGGWINRIHRRLCIKHLIQHRTRKLREISMDEPNFTPLIDNKGILHSFTSQVESQLFIEEIKEIAFDILSQMPRNYGLAVKLLLIGCTNEEIAFALNITVVNARVTIHRAFEKIKAGTTNLRK